MLKLRNAYMPLISIVMTIALLLTLGFTGYFTMQPVCADDDPATEIFSCDAEPVISSIEYSGDRSALGGGCLPQCSCTKIDLAKTGPEKAGVNEEIEYTFTVTNKHSCTYLRDITITDAKLGGIIPVADQMGPNATETKKVKYTVKDSDKPGPLVNNATVTGYHFWDCLHWFPLTCSATWSVIIADPNESKPSIKLTKTAPASAKVGDKVTYSYTITNDGSTPLTNITLHDDKKTADAGFITPNKTELAVGESATATWDYTILSTDPNPVVNNATAKGTYNGKEVSSPASASVVIQTAPSSGASINITKTANEWIRVPGTITYVYTITNDGKLPLTDLSLIDNNLGAIKLPVADLAVNGSTQATQDKNIKDSDYSDWTKVSLLENTATVTAKYAAEAGSGTVDKKATAEVLLFNPKISVTKTADRSSANNGDTIHYNYTVTNNGNAPLHDVTLNDNKLGTITLTATTLAVGAQAAGTAEFKVTDSTARGDLTNTATAKGFYNEPGTEQKEGYVEDIASKTVHINSPGGGGGGGGGSAPSAQIAVDKTADKVTAAAGDTITYTYKIRNYGDYSFSKVELDDNKLGKKTLGALNAGGSTTVTETYTVKDSDPIGELKNIVTVTGFYKQYGYDSQTSATDEAVVTIVSKSESITATTEPVVAEPMQVPPEPQAELPYTGGDALMFGLAGVILICAGIAVSRRLAA